MFILSSLALNPKNLILVIRKCYFYFFYRASHIGNCPVCNGCEANLVLVHGLTFLKIKIDIWD